MEEQRAGFWDRFKSSEAAAFLSTFSTCIGIILLRNPPAFFRAEFWAEDATEYFFGSLTLGIRSIITPVWGFHCFFARVVAWIATLFPVLWTPGFYAGVCLLVNAGVCSYFVRGGFSWIVPARPFRMFVCAMLAVGPGTSEVFLNLCNLQSVLAWFALLLLAEQPLEIGRAKFVLLLLLLLSSVQAVLWAPVAAFLWHRTRHRSYGLLLLCMLPVLFLNWIGTHAMSGEANLRDYGHAGKIPKILMENLFIRLFFMPLLGESLAVPLLREGWLFWSAAAVAGACAVWLLMKGRPLSPLVAGVLGITFACAIGSFGPIVVSRSYAFGQLVRESGVTYWWHRYSYLPGMAALLVWLSVLHSFLVRRPRGLRTAAAVLAVFLLSWNNLAEWGAGYHRTEDLHWPVAAAALQKVLDQKKHGALAGPVAFPDIRWVHPEGWRPAHGELKLVIHPR